jgi:hypothetical protein
MGSIAFILLDIIFQLAIMIGAVCHFPFGRVPCSCVTTQKYGEQSFGQLAPACDAYVNKLVATPLDAATIPNTAPGAIAIDIASRNTFSGHRALVTSGGDISQALAPAPGQPSPPPSPAQAFKPSRAQPSPPPSPPEEGRSAPASARVVGDEDAAEVEEEKWRLFGAAWDAIIRELRAADLLSNRESELLSFGVVDEATADVPLKVRAEELAKELGGRPANAEAQRRLRTFIDTLGCKMPSPPPLVEMRSLSVLTPMYSETILFSYGELNALGSDKRQLIVVLAELMSDEWSNFCERVGGFALYLAKEPYRAAEIAHPDSPHGQDVRWWASMRGQTLSRTVRGMMVYRDALLFQARHAHHHPPSSSLSLTLHPHPSLSPSTCCPPLLPSPAALFCCPHPAALPCCPALIMLLSTPCSSLTGPS